MISITKKKSNEFKVIIKSEVKTIHFVTFDNEWHSKITDGRLSEENLVKLSFRFLLDREPNTSILKKFKLNMISDFFPDYIDYVKHYCSKVDLSD